MCWRWCRQLAKMLDQVSNGRTKVYLMEMKKLNRMVSLMVPDQNILHFLFVNQNLMKFCCWNMELVNSIHQFLVWPCSGRRWRKNYWYAELRQVPAQLSKAWSTVLVWNEPRKQSLSWHEKFTLFKNIEINFLVRLKTCRSIIIYWFII